MVEPTTPINSPFDLPSELQLNILLECCDSYDSLITTIDTNPDFRPLLYRFPFTILSHIVRREIELFADADCKEPAKDKNHHDNGRSIGIHALLLLCNPIFGISQEDEHVCAFLQEAERVRKECSAEGELRAWLRWLNGQIPEYRRSYRTLNLDPIDPSMKSDSDDSLILTKEIVDMMIETHQVFSVLYEDFVADELKRITHDVVLESFVGSRAIDNGARSYPGPATKEQVADVLKDFPTIKEAHSMPVSETEKHKIYQDFMWGYFNHLAFSKGLFTLRADFEPECTIDQSIALEPPADAKPVRVWPDTERLRGEAVSLLEHGLLQSCLVAGWDYLLIPGRSYRPRGAHLIERTSPFTLMTELRPFLEPPGSQMTDEEKLQAIIKYCPPRRITYDWQTGHTSRPEDLRRERLDWIMANCVGQTINQEGGDPRYERGDFEIWDDTRLAMWEFKMEELTDEVWKTHEDFWGRHSNHSRFQ
ncbi:hypothetical protein BJ508DRAFT_360553 [Ascobolus immersus RN42]|uniref:Uncharacterized protein n=1 Tax=Ascobolus immersus RN42 TaxID=1160509 RepID=A0A3N4ICZ7_ASCIM|nr:hypothetical protein BJ508DRAFT_360553 [Ascobolus immersus RN42]